MCDLVLNISLSVHPKHLRRRHLLFHENNHPLAEIYGVGGTYYLLFHENNRPLAEIYDVREVLIIYYFMKITVL